MQTQNLFLLQNLYRLKALGFKYIDNIPLNTSQKKHSYISATDLHNSITNCHLCHLNKTRTQSMQGYGSFKAKILFIDYRVSNTQDSTNSYFCGRSGEILKNMIENVLELTPQDVYLTHELKCIPASTNTKLSSEWESCKNYLFSQIELIQPKIIVTLGYNAYENLTQDEEGFENARGNLMKYENYNLIPIYHPQHLLRNPELKKTTLKDLKKIKSYL